MEDNVYKNKYAVKCALGIIKCLTKLDKVKEEETKRFLPLHDAYMSSDEYKKLQEELRKKDEEEEYRNDTDPKGFEHYKKCVNIFLSFFSSKTQ